MHFRVRADAATHVEVDLYSAATGVNEAIAVVMTRAAAGQPWAADVPNATLTAVGLSAPYLYGYRAWGPNWTYDPSWTNGSSVGFVADVNGSTTAFSEAADRWAAHRRWLGEWQRAGRDSGAALAAAASQLKTKVTA